MSKFLIVIPVYNEERIISNTLFQLNDFLLKNFTDGQYKIAVVDNASNDLTAEIVQSLIPQMPALELISLDMKGKGLAIQRGWQAFHPHDYEIFAFMDADLATDLQALPHLIEGAAQCDVCIGDRYHADSQTIRTVKRALISKAYRNIARTILNSKISDFPCGFKAINRKTLEQIVPKIQNLSWFFDSELLFWAERHGLKIKEIPVRWEDSRPSDQQSKVNILKVSQQYLSELMRLRQQGKEPR